MVHLDNLKELAKNFRLHKSIPNFFRDYTTEDSLVAVLKRYVRNNGAFLSVAPSVARARRAAHPQADNSGGFGGGGGDASHAVGQTTSMENNSVLDGAIVSGGMHAGVLEEFSSQFPADITTSSGDGGQHAQRLTTAGGGSIHTGVSSTEIFHFGGTAGGSVSQISAGKGSWVASANTLHAMGNGRGSRIGGNAPRRPLQPKRLTKVGPLDIPHLTIHNVLIPNTPTNRDHHPIVLATDPRMGAKLSVLEKKMSNCIGHFCRIEKPKMSEIHVPCCFFRSRLQERLYA